MNPTPRLKFSPYMAGRRAYIAGADPTPPGELTRDQAVEWRRGYKDARLWQQRRLTMTR